MTKKREHSPYAEDNIKGIGRLLRWLLGSELPLPFFVFLRHELAENPLVCVELKGLYGNG